MTFKEVLAQIVDWLQQDGRVSYLAVKRQFDLDDDYLEDLKEALSFSHPQACDQEGRGLVWTGEPSRPLPGTQLETDKETRYHALIPDVIARLQRDRRVTYPTLKYIFSLDDALLEHIRRELALRRLAVDDEGQVLVWTGEVPAVPTSVLDIPSDSDPSAVSSSALLPPSVGTETGLPSKRSIALEEPLTTDAESGRPTAMAVPLRTVPDAERRQLTVMFCDLVGSTDLSGRLDPEYLREVVRAYQETAAEVIARYDGHIAQYLGDGLLIYFGFPVAHEDDAQRAVYTGLGIIDAMGALNVRLEADYDVQLAVRIGIHTGPVVVGEMGGGSRHENLALGETPNIAARLEGLAPPNTAVISQATAQLVQRSFVLEELGDHELKGVAEPVVLLRVVGSRTSNPVDDGTISGGFDALVGRDEEIGLLLRRWEQSKDGLGQVVLLSGEAGIGKSSLVDGLRNHVRQEGGTRIAFRCSPYHTNSAFYPIVEHIQRALGWQPEDTADTRLMKLEQALEGSSLPLEEAAPLLGALLSLPVPEGRYPRLGLSPAQQRQQTQDVLVAWLLEEAERQPVLAVWEDLHWADPSTLEALGLLVEQAPTATMLHVLTFRPEFEPPWPTRSHLTPITVNRLERPQVEGLITRLTGDKTLPAEVVEHIVTKTDGVPLYVEELTKMLLASDLLREEVEAYVLTGPLLTVAIPDTLQDSLMARLDQMKTAKEVAQLGSVLGREFDYEMLQAISSQDVKTVQAGLGQLVAAELLYQRGRPPRAKYIFKHALIQDAAYQSLLRSTRQHYHHQIAQVLEERFPEIVETQPELVAHHYTEAGLAELAIGYWRRAGQRESERSAYQEAISHVTTGLTLLQTLPETLERHQQELPLQTTLGTASLILKGHGAPETEAAYTRARLLCQQLGDTQDVFPVLLGLWRFYVTRSHFSLSGQLAEELLGLAKRRDEPPLYVVAHYGMGANCMYVGELRSARRHLEEGFAYYSPAHRSAPMFRVGQDPGVGCRAIGAWTMWLLGYPDQALAGARDALEVAAGLDHPFSDAFAHDVACMICQFRREATEVDDYAEATITLSTEQGFPYWLAKTTFLQGWALTALGQRERGLSQMSQGLRDVRATGAEVFAPYFLTLLAEGYGALNRVHEGLDTLKEGLELVERMGSYFWKAEMYRLQGELRLQQAVPDVGQAETCFHQALDLSCGQHAKSLELRAATSLARLWRHQSKRQEAYDILAPVYGWFTEGFDTPDLIESKTLLNELTEGLS